jgi:hypothetical protein
VGELGLGQPGVAETEAVYLLEVFELLKPSIRQRLSIAAELPIMAVMQKT